ncbi:MAG: hypothetical protein R6T96_00475 [Longimicrobiales bacterium]
MRIASPPSTMMFLVPGLVLTGCGDHSPVQPDVGTPVSEAPRASQALANHGNAQGQGTPATEVYMASLKPLNDSGVEGMAKFTVVLHGAFVEGEYNVTLPVACGVIHRIN